jgi:hypothetical protein
MAEHVACMAGIRNICGILVGISLVMFRCSWEDSIEIHFKNLEDRIHVDQDRNHWQDFWVL